MKWRLEEIEPPIEDIKELFGKTQGHKHADNYSKWSLFEHTKFGPMGWDPI